MIWSIPTKEVNVVHEVERRQKIYINGTLHVSQWKRYHSYQHSLEWWVNNVILFSVNGKIHPFLTTKCGSAAATVTRVYRMDKRSISHVVAPPLTQPIWREYSWSRTRDAAKLLMKLSETIQLFLQRTLVKNDVFCKMVSLSLVFRWYYFFHVFAWSKPWYGVFDLIPVT